MHDAPAELVEQARARVGRVLCGKYRVDRLIGIGGMASVFEGTHLRNANRVALKILHRDLAMSGDTRARFLREGYAANSVGHPGTVRVLDDDKAEDGSIFLVMELLDGETLDARLNRSLGRLGVSEVVTLIVDVLDALAAAHDKGIVHRDIKPENLFLTREGKVKLLDFGIARLRTISPIRTGSDTMFGTPAFMSPEQALGRTQEVDAQSDVWAVGATAFTLLAGRHVHESPTAAEMIVRRGSVPAPKLGSIVPNVPPSIASVIDRALAFDRAERWPSAQAMRDALAKAREALVPGEIEDDEREEHTKVSPPTRATSLDFASLATAAPPDHVSSTVGAVVTKGHTRRTRSRRQRVALALAAASGVVLAILVALLSGQPKSAPSVLAASPPARHATASSAETPAQGAAAPMAPQASGGAGEASLPVEALPKASTPALALPTASAPGTMHARSIPAAQPAVSTATSKPAAPTPKRDPLSPW
jgi:serine/threonine protein kinase